MPAPLLAACRIIRTLVAVSVAPTPTQCVKNPELKLFITNIEQGPLDLCYKQAKHKQDKGPFPTNMRAKSPVDSCY